MVNQWHIKEEKIPGHESAACKVIHCADGSVILQSYSTKVICIDADGWLYCSGLYSRTTIKHIGWFMRLYGHGCGYYTAKAAYESQTVVNLATGEVLTYDEYDARPVASVAAKSGAVA